MTLEAYLQPFMAVGDYTDIRKLARPKSFDFAPVALADNPDFNRKSVRGTVVLRWEYVRGSTLFAVWNLSTSDTAARARASSRRCAISAAPSARRAPTSSPSSSVTGSRPSDPGSGIPDPSSSSVHPAWSQLGLP